MIGNRKRHAFQARMDELVLAGIQAGADDFEIQRSLQAECMTAPIGVVFDYFAHLELAAAKQRLQAQGKIGDRDQDHQDP